MILNERTSRPTFHSTIGCSWIDLILYQNMNKNELIDFQVHDEITLSDHDLITLHFCLYSIRKNKVSKIFLNNVNSWKFALEFKNILNIMKLNMKEL